MKIRNVRNLLVGLIRNFGQFHDLSSTLFYIIIRYIILYTVLNIIYYIFCKFIRLFRIFCSLFRTCLVYLSYSVLHILFITSYIFVHYFVHFYVFLSVISYILVHCFVHFLQIFCTYSVNLLFNNSYIFRTLFFSLFRTYNLF